MSDFNYERDVKNAGKPVLIDFYATWCGPCKVLSKKLDQFEKDYEEQIKVIRLNIVKHSEFAMNNNVRGVPSLLLYREGRFVDQYIGDLTMQQLEEFTGVNVGN